MEQIISPYGGQLVNLIASPERSAELKQAALDFATLDINWQQQCDLELLLNGGYSPLTGYMGQADYVSVLQNLRLADGRAWPLPLCLQVSAAQADKIKVGDSLALRDGEGFMLAVVTVSELWQADDALEASLLGGELGESWYIGGAVEGVSLPMRHDFLALRQTPAEQRAHFLRRGWRQVIAWQARQPLHRAQHAFILRAAVDNEANLLIHPMAGGDPVESAEYFSLVRSYRAAIGRFPSATSTLALSPVYARGGGVRTTLLGAIIERNYGCTHLIVGGEHATQGQLRRGSDVVTHEDYQHVAEHIHEIGVGLIPFPRMVYVEDRAQFMAQEEVPKDARVLLLTAEEVARRLQEGVAIPDWYTFPEVLAEIQRSHPPRSQQGFTVFFTGLSGAGKSTIARALTTRLMEMGGRSVTLLDGDIVRRNLSSELGFTREHRDINVRRIGYVASEITKNRGIAICAPIAPYTGSRRAVRNMIEPLGGFFEIFVATPIATCESRDRKGLYAKARAGIIKEFTGISDPYETPERAELSIDTTNLSVDEAVQRILLKLEHEGYLR
ncbi:bifunctional sulfate adenylyltransferase/adenylylsulfate kinase [Sulfuriferula sp.]|uniref:bifunctional sulfate adenylyltransferase/adenylylsulfate kinase n=1 Tax=Sulfuriferula sp. TaxID=2025307 RepID=UPI0027310488|nr:bifunctional sulfate adenylyltransferase/adenylylsulfate kinase [Sulfuriferula sp.]MDP2027421.1 bifunctional sulfate adenylyltransferase/adenylylsulfate kinase [Sulfuriferula sp.]